MSDTTDYKNLGTVCVLYLISPPLAEGAETSSEMIEVVKEAFINDQALFSGFMFPESGHSLEPENNFTGTSAYFTAELNGATPFNDDSDFRPGILTALIDGECTVTLTEHEDSKAELYKIHITLNDAIA